ncbi:MAG TPA: DinB family protein [Ardenticatenaceae bacterium]|nr:DinB family protein [Ardenticatenaceae bacterium]
MDKAKLLERLIDGRARWDEALAGIDESHLAEPGASGEMSIKDLIAHVTWYEHEMVGLLDQRALVGSELWGLSDAERNAAILAANRERPLGEVRAEAQRVFEQLVEAVRSLSDEELVDASKYRDMPADWVPWQLLADNSYEHYEHHMPDVEALAREEP